MAEEECSQENLKYFRDVEFGENFLEWELGSGFGVGGSNGWEAGLVYFLMPRMQGGSTPLANPRKAVRWRHLR